MIAFYRVWNGLLHCKGSELSGKSELRQFSIRGAETHPTCTHFFVGLTCYLKYCGERDPCLLPWSSFCPPPPRKLKHCPSTCTASTVISTVRTEGQRRRCAVSSHEINPFLFFLYIVRISLIVSCIFSVGYIMWLRHACPLFLCIYIEYVVTVHFLTPSCNAFNLSCMFTCSYRMALFFPPSVTF